MAKDLRTHIAVAEDRILILTPAALYRFQAESEAWTVTTTADGLPNAPFLNLSVTGGNIWICGGGISISDLRFDDWQRYGPGEGYPGRFVFDAEADEDYAYAGTEEGAARFDRYILEWETLDGPPGSPLGTIRDVAVGEDRVWFALERGIAEYRKEPESFRIDSLLGQFDSPEVLALRQTARFLWAFTDAGIARYDKDLQSWTSFRTGIDLPEARVHQLTLHGDDLWLGTDAGLWRYRSDTGIWRRDESGDEMPGQQVRAFALDSRRIWVVTERAFAVYEQDAARWIDFTSSVPLEPSTVREVDRIGGTLVFVGEEKIVYGLTQGQENPSLFTYRSRPIRPSKVSEMTTGPGWWFGLDDAGLTLKRSSEADLHLKGGATIFVEDYDQDAKPGLGEFISETRLDLTLGGRHESDRTLSGLYDSTDPDNSVYQLTYRGARSDVLRVVSVGEIEQQLFNSRLVPGTGLTGGRVRAEVGQRLEKTRRRFLTADAWAGERRTLPGRDTFYGGSRTVEGQTRDVNYVRGQVLPIPEGWTEIDLRNAVLYLDDNDATTDDANSEHRTLAGRAGAWDRLQPNVDYVIGPGGETAILVSPLEADHALVAVRPRETSPPGLTEIDLGDLWLRNHYWITTEPIPGSLVVTIVDSAGSSTDVTGTSYTERFGLDDNGDGLLDPERFSPISGLLSFPDNLPFPHEVYAEDPASLFTIQYSYRTTLNTYQLSHRDLLPQSERITVDRVLLKPGTDYSFIPASGLFILFEHVLIDEDTLIEVEYLYEVGGNAEPAGRDERMVFGGQIGLAPDDRLYVGANATRWSDEDGLDVTTAGLNARLEWKDEDHFLRLTPELASSQTESQGFGDGGGRTGGALGMGFQGRYRNLEASASHRTLDGDFTSFEDRRTLLGRLREESSAWSRLTLSRHLQAELEWEESRSDQLIGEAAFAAGTTSDDATDSLLSGWGKESSLTGSLRLLRSGWPNLEVRRGRILLDVPGRRQEKWISRAEMELSPEQAGVRPLGIRRLWLRAFFQRSERELKREAEGRDTDSLLVVPAEKRSTDHAFVRLNGSLGPPLSWNVAFEDRRTFLPQTRRNGSLRRLQAVDATLQTQPHSSLDAFLRWESGRDLFWHPGGGPGGFSVRRLLLATVQLYPGRILEDLSPISFRFDLGSNETEEGEPGVALPGGGCLWTPPPNASQQRRTRNGVIEARVQVRPRIRLVERLEIESNRTTREGLRTEGDGWRLENRLEMRPHGGLLILRAIGATSDNWMSDEEKRFSGQWDQGWGRGFLTFISLEARQTERRDRNVGNLTQLWNPEMRVTWRRSRWQLDASLGGSMTWTRSKDTSVGAGDAWGVTRKQSLTAQLSLQPWKILSLKVQYWLNRSQIESDSLSSGSEKAWETDHDLHLRLQIRA